MFCRGYWKSDSPTFSLLTMEMEYGGSSGRSYLVDALAILFGISSWVEISGLSVELPLMVERLPEGWTLPSYIVVVTQLANIGPLIYTIARSYWHHKILEVPAVHITLGIAFTSCLLLSFLWDQTTLIGGRKHSTALIALCFCLAFVDCTSSVLYLPFMARFREIYVISCMIGEGMSGLLPSIMGLIQGVGGNPECQNITVPINDSVANETVHKLVPYIPKPLFSVEVYFIFLCVMIMVSWIAFVLLNKLPRIQSERVSPLISSPPEYDDVDDPMDAATLEENRAPYPSMNMHFTEWREYTRFDLVVLLFIQTYVCVMQNGVLSSVQSFSCLPYGSVAYHLSVNLSMISNPIACFIAVFLPSWSMSSIVMWTVFSSVWAAYILAAALLSPYPPLVDHTFGAVLIVFSWTVFVGSVSYVKACIAGILRRSGGNKALFWGGGVSQIGSFVGGVGTFVLVNFTDLFKSSSHCPAE